jgi:hypothetical protein
VTELDVLGEELYEGRLGVEAEGVVGEVDGVKVWEREQRRKEVGEGGWYFGEQASREDVGEVCDLIRYISMIYRASFFDVVLFIEG